MTLKPYFKDNNIAIAMSSSDEYLPYLTVCLQSLVANTSAENKYDIVIFTESENQEKMQEIINFISKDNILLRFFNPANYFENVELQVTHSYFHKACYFRIAAPVILKEFSRVIFTDIDLIFQEDIAKLYLIDLQNAPLSACIEPIWEMFIETDYYYQNYSIRDYSKNILKIEDTKKYFNTGVVIFDTNLFIENKYFEKLLDVIKNTHLIFQEQDALNYLLTDKILPLDASWNSATSLQFDELKHMKQNIIHYLGHMKPWQDFEQKQAYMWWQYARKTPFYEVILSNNLKDITAKSLETQKIQLTNLLFDVYNYKKNVLKYWRYKFIKTFSFGKRRKWYKEKMIAIKIKIKNAKNFQMKEDKENETSI
ncbi:MAG: glycosyltransferase [Candidatus Gastranaerophilales bacterium]